MKMSEDTKTELGEIKIHNHVISSIAIEATKQIAGIIKISGNLKNFFFQVLGIKEHAAIKIKFDKNNEVTINIPIVVKYGYNIPEIAAKVQENVKLAIENATNINVREINVDVQEIENTNS